jgi:hypothetical protein
VTRPGGRPAWQDSLLTWFEEFTRRVMSGVYRAGVIKPDLPLSPGLSLFPWGDAMSVAVSMVIVYI